jgi:hypothetical protein
MRRKAEKKRPGNEKCLKYINFRQKSRGEKEELISSPQKEKNCIIVGIVDIWDVNSEENCPYP